MIHIKKLSNNITVVLEPMPYLRSAAFGVWVKAGSVNETIKNNGIAHVIEHMLFKGTTNRDAKKIADDMAKIGGNMNAYTSKEGTSYYATTLSEHLPIAIDILSDMLKNSLIDADALEKEKCVILEEIDMYDDSPEDLVHEMLQKEIWKDHSLGYIISGEKEVVKSFTRDDIIEFMNQYYVANNIVISIAGRFEESEILQLLEESFGDIKQGNPEIHYEAPVYHRCMYTKEKDIEQVHLNLAFDSIPYDNPEKYVLSIYNSILGGSINSRLFLNIRDNLGLTYSIYSYGSSQKNAGLFHIYAAMNPGQTEVVLDKIWEEIENIKQFGITEEELSMTKEQLKTELIMGSESAKSKMNSNAKAIITRGYIISVQEIIDSLNSVTREDVLKFVNKYFHRNQASIALVGNVESVNIKSIRKKLEFLN